ncbi:P-loop containing nucleoside triphosphate hydrolase protein [Polyplosphaeria fusca]|uniref:P-loop containing nucleoside triphosphate hydrolase protein n=1 Tax=Polyplosphaeria fusca TaxID=682080 RepID=A0A9P4R4V6_9PLEO|nr:P-loop containing nucleoside triphosphate hydrolase protein [Polyplosphaeria fusca]
MSQRANSIDSIDGPETVGTACELRIRQQRYDKNGKQVEEIAPSLKIPLGEGADKEYAVVVKQVFDNDHKLDEESVIINSAHLLKAFSKIIGTYPTVAADFTEPFELDSPYQMLYHYWDELASYMEACDDDVARQHLNLLLDFMEMSMGPERKRCDTQLKKGQVDYARLWTIFRPGDTQLRCENGHLWLQKCVKTAYEESKREGKFLEVHCLYTDFDGKNTGEAKFVTKIHQKKYFAAENPAVIQDLIIYPRKFYADDGLEERLSKRGDVFMTLRETCVRQYDGQAGYMKRPPMDFWDPDMALFGTIWLPFKETGRVVIDRKTFQEDNELSQIAISVCPEQLDKTTCPPFVIGYSLAIKEWCRFYIPHIENVSWNDKSLESLVMKKDQKSLLHALVSSHHFPENPRDASKQKGKGLVILLHGSPGSGKTLTAECCAEITQKALFSTSLAELNKENRPWWFERRLSEVLQYATTWKAVVLFDEADVFLEKRKEDAADASERNALVAVFLRHLEYFSGIVFLTTNRVSVFDEAMKSRIHLALGYNPPTLDMRRMLWTKSLITATQDPLEEELEEAIDEFTRVDLNGREIANAVNTALTLARFEKGALQLRHVEQVLKVRRVFDKDLKKMAEEDKRRKSTGVSRQGSILGPMYEDLDRDS